MLITNKITDIINALEKGGVLAFRTDTLFSLSCDATNNQAVSQIYKMKRRAVHKALPIFIDSIENAKKYVQFNDTSIKIATKFWPGALTIVLPLQEPSSISPLIHRDQRNIAIRIPDSPLLREVIKCYGKPIVATSANLSGAANPTTELELKQYFDGKVDICVSDTSAHTSYINSTIIHPNEDSVQFLRIGKISKEDILKVI